MKKTILLLCSCWLSFFAFSQTETQSDSAKIETIRTQSGVDPTRVQTRVGYSFFTNNPEGAASLVFNRLSANIGVGRWSINSKFDIGSRTGDVQGTGFSTGLGDLRFSILNAFFVKDKHAMAASVEFVLPTGRQGIGLQYFSATPAFTYSYTIKPTLVFAIQPQYSFDLAKDPLFPELSVLTIRSFLAHFSPKGYFIVLEPRPIINFVEGSTDFVLSPIFGQSIGRGFNLIFLAEFVLTENLKKQRVSQFQVGFNKNF